MLSSSIDKARFSAVLTNCIPNAINRRAFRWGVGKIQPIIDDFSTGSMGKDSVFNS